MNKLPNGNRVVYVHARDPKNPRTGICHALEVDGNNNAIAMGFALCGPKDNYSKKIGRTISVGRLTSEERRIALPPSSLKDAITACVSAANKKFEAYRALDEVAAELSAAAKRILSERKFTVSVQS